MHWGVLEKLAALGPAPATGGRLRGRCGRRRLCRRSDQRPWSGPASIFMHCRISTWTLRGMLPKNLPSCVVPIAEAPPQEDCVGCRSDSFGPMSACALPALPGDESANCRLSASARPGSSAAPRRICRTLGPGADSLREYGHVSDGRPIGRGQTLLGFATEKSKPSIRGGVIGTFLEIVCLQPAL